MSHDTQPGHGDVKAILEARLCELTERAEDLDHQLSETPEADWEENAIASEQDEVQEKIGRVAVAEIAQIKQALFRIDQGTYGKCSRCGTTIPAERLESLPFSTLCVKCSPSSR